MRWFTDSSIRFHRSGVEMGAVVFLLVLVSSASAQWPQFGGPDRNFISRSTGLAETWPEDGPTRLWERRLGDGYSGICIEDGILITMYRKGAKEVVVAMDASTGDVRWEQAYRMRLYKRLDRNFGLGPRSTPLISNGRIYTVGISGNMHCLDFKSGEIQWSHDLYEEFGGTKVMWGYSSSPLLYNDTVILPVGGKGHGIMAFRADDGSVAWAKHDFPNAYSSGLLIDLDGQQQLVVLMAKEVVGLNPDDGQLLWKYKHTTSYDVNATSPLWCDGNRLFLSSAYNTGSRMLQLTKEGDHTTVSELWRQRKMQTHFGNVIQVDGRIYGSSGGNGPIFFTAVDQNTGKIAFRKRGGLAKSQMVYADGKLILLDEDGVLAIGSLQKDGLKIHSQVKLLENVSWTAPTLVNKTVYIRDKKKIMALDLG